MIRFHPENSNRITVRRLSTLYMDLKCTAVRCSQGSVALAALQGARVSGFSVSHGLQPVLADPGAQVTRLSQVEGQKAGRLKIDLARVLLRGIRHSLNE